MSLLVLSASDVERIVASFTHSELQYLMARVFALLSSQSSESSIPEVYTPHRTSIPMSNHNALFMPARIAQPSLVGTTIKVVCVPRGKEDSRGLPASSLVLDEETGSVKAIVNARSLTALRNASGSLLSTNIVGLRCPENMVVFGAGKQVEAHLDLHIRFFPSITSCTIVNRTANQRAQNLQSLMEARFPQVSFTLLESSPVHGNDLQPLIEHAVRSASLIICATSSTSPLFPSHWVRSGTHVILIGSYTPAMREVERELVLRAISRGTNWAERRTGTQITQILMVDSREACASEAGELIDAGVERDVIVEIGEMVPLNEQGDIDLDILDAQEVATAIVGTDISPNDGVEGDFQGPITMFKSVGVGVQDVTIACAVVEKAEQMGNTMLIGTRIPGYDDVGH